MRPAIPILSFLLLVGCEWSEKSSADRKANTATIPPEQGNVAAQANDDGAPMVAQSAREGGGSKEIDKTSSAPIPKDKWNLDYAEKSWGTKLKTLKYTEQVLTVPGNNAPGVSIFNYKLLIQFTKDLKDDELKGFRQAMGGGTLQGMELVVLDQDNVVVGKVNNGQIEGELTGVKDDAFWFVIRANLIAQDKGKKVELRVQKK